MKHLLIGALAFAMPILAFAGIDGVYATEKNENGDYAHVKMAPCGDSICGSIVWSSSDSSSAIGTKIVWDMKANGDNSWNNGKIMDPVKKKTYNSKMTLSGDVLKVSGCIGPICRAQNWTRVK